MYFSPSIDIYEYYTSGFDSYKQYEGQESNDIKYAELFTWVNEWVDDKVRKERKDKKIVPRCKPSTKSIKEFINLAHNISDDLLTLYKCIESGDEYEIVPTIVWMIYDDAYSVNTGSELLDQIVRHIMCTDGGRMSYWYMNDATDKHHLMKIASRVEMLLNIASIVEYN